MMTHLTVAQMLTLVVCDFLKFSLVWKAETTKNNKINTSQQL